MRLVQIAREQERYVGMVDGVWLRLLDAGRCATVYSLAVLAIERGDPITSVAEDLVGPDSLEYDLIYEGRSPWRLLPAADHPVDAAHCMVSGTGLTHKKSAENRAAMHNQKQAAITDSFRMYQMGLEGGSPERGRIGVQPEWFYKGDGSILRAHGEPLVIPAFGWDGGEEPEIAGIYVIAPSGEPFRIGLTVGNEFSDHRMERENYLYLAPSKLRNCSIGPELTVGEVDFENVPGTVAILRNDQPLWRANIWTGGKNMSHSIANLEHHQFKYASHRRPGDVHVHFFGADAFSFGAGIDLERGDIMEISFPAFGRSLRNTLEIDHRRPEQLLQVRAL